MTVIGLMVEHAHFGRGQVLAVYRGGDEWLVRFDSGLTFRRPRHEFGGDLQAPLAADRFSGPAAPLPAPMLPDRVEARRVVEALRVGVAPPRQVRELTIGLEAERDSLAAGFNEALQQGGAVRAVIGEYGFGKSHFVQLAAEEALARRFLVASIGLDIVELPASRPFDLYAALMRSLRYPDSDDRGLTALLEAVATPRVLDLLRERAPIDDDPLTVALTVMAEPGARRGRHAWQQWLMGARKAKGMAKALPRGRKMPALYSTGHNERQLSYLLTTISALARLANYSGLVLLIDEAESYAMLRPLQRAKAASFFGALTYAAQGPGRSPIDETTLAQHRRRDYPPRFGDGQSLFFLFTLTHSDNQMPLERWIGVEQLLSLDPHPSAAEIGAFMQQAQAYHARAFGYEIAERHGQMRRAATELLAEAVRHERLSIRGVVRLVVELCDLLFLHPQYDVPTLLAELRGQLR